MSNASAGSYTLPLEDIRFVLNEWLDAPSLWARIPALNEMDAPTAEMVVEEIGRFCSEVLAPINASGDLQGCRWSDGKVTTPEGFTAAYQAFVDGGWPALACDTEVGGQGLPQLLDAVLNEAIVSANHAWAMYPGLSHGAYACLHAHANEHIKSTYLPNIVSGEWLASMCLTEPQAGSDLGLVRTRAIEQEDGSYAINGNKIFISGGEHDLSPNIVHLVLARLPDAPAGSKGLSLFVVPKRIPVEGDLRRNAVYCDGIEKKMGIKGSATCTMRFEDAQGWLVGEPHKGLAAMFIMMNSARLHVGLQGLGHAESAYQLAYRYAFERRQMRIPVRSEGTAEAADLIALHPPIQRILLDLRVWTEGMRMVAYWTGHLLDVSDNEPDKQKRQDAHLLMGLLTPVVKSFFTERGFQLASSALQVFGGYGYIHEYGIEQVVRDSRISMIYEGTNEIQAIDLLERKVLPNKAAFSVLMQEISSEIDACNKEAICQSVVQSLTTLRDDVTRVTDTIAAHAQQDASYPRRCADDYLRLLGHLLIAFAWTKAARISMGKDDDLHTRKLSSANHFLTIVYPEITALIGRIEIARQPLPALE